MWTEQHGKYIWSDEAKMLLVHLVKKYPDSIRGGRIGRNGKKSFAWEQIYAELYEHGMPPMPITRIKVNWQKYQERARILHDQLKRNKKSPPLSPFHRAIIDAVNSANIKKKIMKNLMPVPIPIKTEPIDNDEMENNEMEEADENEEADNNESMDTNNETLNQSKYSSQSHENFNPVVLLHRIDENKIDAKPLTETPSNEYWKIMKQIAENDLKLKFAQREHERKRMEFENERMELERQWVQKKSYLLDLKIRVETEKLEALSKTVRF